MANAEKLFFPSGVSSELGFINQCRKFAEAGDDTYADNCELQRLRRAILKSMC